MPTFVQRMQLVLPPWWGNSHPTLDSLVNGYAAGHHQIRVQTDALLPLMRLNSVTGDLLDIASYDFLGNTLPRKLNEIDDFYRLRVKAELFRLRGIRTPFIERVTALSGSVPDVIDPRRPYDTGATGNVLLDRKPTLFYNSVRRDSYTNIKMGYQWFVRLTNSGGYSNAVLLAKIAELMPAGTVSWTMFRTP